MRARCIWAAISRPSPRRNARSGRAITPTGPLCSSASRAASTPPVPRRASIRCGPTAMFRTARTWMSARPSRTRSNALRRGFGIASSRAASTPRTQLHAYNPNYIGGDINGGVQDLAAALDAPHRPDQSVCNAAARGLSMFIGHATGRRRPRPVWDVRGAGHAGPARLKRGLADHCGFFSRWGRFGRQPTRQDRVSTPP